MENDISSNLKLFICYSHSDEEHVKEFIKHISPLKQKGFIKEWYDRKLIAGQKYQDTIDNNLNNADIICLIISANFLYSNACIEEKEKSFELLKKKDIVIIPIILSPCGWSDYIEISQLLALPTDGKPITDYSDSNKGWLDVYEGIKKVILNELNYRNLKITGNHSTFLQSSDVFTRASTQKEKVFFDDIFVFPELNEFDYIKGKDEKINSEILINNFCRGSKYIIAGEDQSGKTFLCKKFFCELRKKYFVPIYINDKSKNYAGLIENKIQVAFNEQYENADFEDIEKERIVLIIDDFHYAKKKAKHIDDLSRYINQIIIVDDIPNLNFRNENNLRSYKNFFIKQYCPSLRNSLIEKWINLKDYASPTSIRYNDMYKEIDETTENVNTTLGKIFSSGIMPSYPFFILTIISTYESGKKINQDITSQGYCYQALIYLFLNNIGAKNDEIDTYINFLTEFAFYIYKEKRQELSHKDFETFMNLYIERFNLPVKKEILLQNLQKTRILYVDSFNNYTFGYSYIYYFFVAKYLSENNKDNINIINSLINNLHTNENAYITIFLSYHSKSLNLLDNIVTNAKILFKKYQPATLTKKELHFFDNNLDKIIEILSAQDFVSPEIARKENLKQQDIIEENQINSKSDCNDDDNDNEFSIDIRRSFRIVEVIGIIIKNRSGSLERNKLENAFEEAMNVHLRLLNKFFELIEDEKSQNEIVEFIRKIIENISIEKQKILTNEQINKYARIIFWNLNYECVLGFIGKIIHSLGSNKLLEIVENLCDRVNTPATFLIKHGIFMWYDKNLQINKIATGIKEDRFSKTAKGIIFFLIRMYCNMHEIKYKDKQKIEDKFKIKLPILLPKSSDN